MSHAIAVQYGFPNPNPAIWVRDALGRFWKWDDEPHTAAGLSDLGAWSTIVGAGGAAASGGLGLAGSLGAGALLGPIGAGIGIITGLIAGILGQHAAKVKQENQVSGQWAAGGPQTVDSIMAAWEAGQLSASDATTALQSVYTQFKSANQGIAKYNGQQGAFPDPNAARPASNCNWACGTSYDLAQEIKGLVGQISGNPDVGAQSLTSSSGGLSPLALGLGALALLMVLK